MQKVALSKFTSLIIFLIFPKFLPNFCLLGPKTVFKGHKCWVEMLVLAFLFNEIFAIGAALFCAFPGEWAYRLQSAAAPLCWTMRLPVLCPFFHNGMAQLNAPNGKNRFIKK